MPRRTMGSGYTKTASVFAQLDADVYLVSLICFFGKVEDHAADQLSMRREHPPVLTAIISLYPLFIWYIVCI